MATSADAHIDHDSPEYIKSHVKVYVAIGISLLLLTGLTVEVASWRCGVEGAPVLNCLNSNSALYVALAIAGVKGSLVAAYFMHLVDEKKIIYATLALTVVFFFFVVLVPLKNHQPGDPERYRSKNEKGQHVWREPDGQQKLGGQQPARREARLGTKKHELSDQRGREGQGCASGDSKPPLLNVFVYLEGKLIDRN